jgi:hypothetical protein
VTISPTVARRVISAWAAAFALVFLHTGPTVSGQAARDPKGPQLLNFSVSPPVREMPPQAVAARAPKEAREHRIPRRRRGALAADPVVQTSTSAPMAAQAVGQWEGVGAGYPGFSVTAVPPDTNIAVGPQHIVEWVNNAFVVFDKQGVQIQAPVADSTFWGLSTCYQFGGYSDPIVQYDKVADRWIVGEVAIPLLPPLLGQFAQCFAVSTTSDPTGSYYMWGYGFGTNVNDYPKIGVWPDGYYITWNIFAGGGSTFTGPEACAWDRNGMLNGVAAPAFVCFTLPDSFDSLLPSDWDGTMAPPAGSPNLLFNINIESGGMNVWRLHADFVNKANSTLSGPTPIAAVAPFTTCLDPCIPQPGTSEQLDSLSDRLMYRLAYRNFGDHESWVLNHTVFGTAGNAAVRWYEVRNPNGTPTIYQQGTFAPDADYRFMGSIAMDRTGNIGVGYNAASSGTYPSVRYTGRQVGDPLGILQTETVAVAGGGSQNGYDRWGDYSAMRIDPSDDCTFWYAQEYQATTTATANWNTRIVSFRFPTCGQSLTSTTTTVNSTPNPSTSGQSVTLTATLSPSAATGTVEFFDGSTSLGTAPLSGGTASLLTSALSVGSHSISATYSGDSSYATSTSVAITQVVNASSIGTTTALTSSPNPSTYGQSVLFTATVSPASGTGTPSGTVTFLDGATTLGSSALNASGVATLSVSNLSVAAHSIKAQYNGSSTFSGSASAVVTQTVNKASTATTLTSSRNPSNLGQSVTFTATVSPSTASGSVQFLDGSTVLSTATLSAGRASVSTATLAAGSHSITAKYSGDTKYNGSTSAVVTQTVKKTRK